MDAFHGHVGLFGSFGHVQFVLTPLTLGPDGQLWVFGVFRGDVAVSIAIDKGPELAEAFLPKGTVGVPDKAQLVKNLLAAFGHGRVLSL